MTKDSSEALKHLATMLIENAIYAHNHTLWSQNHQNIIDTAQIAITQVKECNLNLEVDSLLYQVLSHPSQIVSDWLRQKYPRAPRI